MVEKYYGLKKCLHIILMKTTLQEREYAKQYREANNEKIVAYREAHKEEKATIHQQYMQRPEVIARMNEQVVCDCGKSFTRCRQSRHITQEHHRGFIRNNVHPY